MARSVQASTGRIGRKHWSRHLCHVHIGDPAPQIPPRVLFADLPEERLCPNCAAPPSKFTRLGDDR
ncbi:rubredoxin [Sinorhizobium americanum]|uniref:rubredoxin n=1 Tax=Sinorhizobium americanum TaxID=194963 RepID=UPI0010444FC7